LDIIWPADGLGVLNSLPGLYKEKDSCLEHGIDACSAVRRTRHKHVAMVRGKLNTVDCAVVGVKREVDWILQWNGTLNVTCKTNVVMTDVTSTRDTESQSLKSRVLTWSRMSATHVLRFKLPYSVTINKKVV